MKSSQQKQFSPINLTIETEDEYTVLCSIFGSIKGQHLENLDGLFGVKEGTVANIYETLMLYETKKIPQHLLTFVDSSPDVIQLHYNINGETLKRSYIGSEVSPTKYVLPLSVMQDNNGFFIGITDLDGKTTRVSVGHYDSYDYAEEHLDSSEWGLRTKF